MKLTMLGMYAPYAPAGRATSVYLLDGGGEMILLDCGSGILERLQRVASIDAVSAVVLTHLHGDHIADMTLLRYALPYRKRFGLGEKERMTVFSPSAPEAEYDALRAMKPFDITPVEHGLKAQIGEMTLEFFEMSHPYPAYGVRAACEGKVFAYTGDTVMCPNASALARDADLLLCDASFLEADRTDTATHMSAAQAAALARDNGVKKLIITHHLTHYPEGLHLPEAKAIFHNTRQAFEMRSYVF
jgi:ribonuclease BN (tRNA processing enzyme)